MSKSSGSISYGSAFGSHKERQREHRNDILWNRPVGPIIKIEDNDWSRYYGIQNEKWLPNGKEGQLECYRRDEDVCRGSTTWTCLIYRVNGHSVSSWKCDRQERRRWPYEKGPDESSCALFSGWSRSRRFANKWWSLGSDRDVYTEISQERAESCWE